MAARPYHHGELPAALLEAVDETVRAEGAVAVSLRQVARRAGVSHAAPAHHFGDKAGLLTAYAAQGFEALREALLVGQRAAEEGGGDPLLSIGLAYIRFAVTEPGRFSVMFRPEEVRADDARYRAAYDGAFEVLFRAVADLRSDLAPDDPDVLYAATGAWTGVHGFATLWLDGSLPDELMASSPEESAWRMMVAWGTTLFVMAGVAADGVGPPVRPPGTLEGGGVGQATASSPASVGGAEESPDSTGQDAG